MHVHPGDPATEVRPAAVAAQRSAHGGPPRLHTRYAWPLVQFVVLNRVDVLDKDRRGRPSLDAEFAVPLVDQSDAHTVGAGNRLDGELGHVPEKVEHPLRAGHNPGHSAKPRIQLGLIGFPLGSG